MRKACNYALTGESKMYTYSKKEKEKLEEYIQEQYGEISEVFQELCSPDIQCEILIVNPTENQPYYKLITMGAGAYKMNVPKGVKKSVFERAEYAMYLPKDWDLKNQKEEFYWPIRQLKNIARLSIKSNSWLCFGHTVSAYPDSSPVAENTKLNSFMILPLLNGKRDIVKPLKLGFSKKINFYEVFPIYQEELSYKLNSSLEELYKLIDPKDLYGAVDINRKNYCAENSTQQKKIKITGTATYIDVEMDGKSVRIQGELVKGGFICDSDSIKNWTVPNEIVMEEEKDEIIKRVTEKTKGSHMVITFEGGKNQSSENSNSENDDKAAGWDAIDREFLRVYPGQTNPKHYGTLVRYSLGGKDPLDGISIYEGKDYYHFVSYGLTEIYEKENEDKETSGFGYEFTFKLKKDDYEDEEAELKNVCGILQAMARLVFENGEVFNPDEYIYTGQTEGIDARQKSKLTGFIIVSDPVVNAIETPNGHVQFLELIGMTDSELKTLSSRDSVKEMYAKLGSDITDYNRSPIV